MRLLLFSEFYKQHAHHRRGATPWKGEHLAFDAKQLTACEC